MKIRESIQVLLFAALVFTLSSVNAATIIDHRHTDITSVPLEAIVQAKQRLHIAYNHTSHGEQLITGMTGLVEFANNQGLGLSLPQNTFAWNNGGLGGALDIHDIASTDAGVYPYWVDFTRAYLNAPENSDVNVFIWAWCGQVPEKYTDGTLYSEYLLPMSQLEREYPHVSFVYMTGHTDIDLDAASKAGNRMIREFVTANNKILYDFADIERYDPDGNYYPYVNDDCTYYDGLWPPLGNWALEWQNNHTEGVDWYNCESAHSQPLNANRKAYAAWYLWAVLGGWVIPGDAGINISESEGSTAVTEGGAEDSYEIVLISQPTSTVTLKVDPDEQLDIGKGAGVPLTMQFGVADWDQGQSVTVRAVDDTLPECGHSGTIRHTVNSADDDYNGLYVRDIVVKVSDNDRSCSLSGINILLLH